MRLYTFRGLHRTFRGTLCLEYRPRERHFTYGGTGAGTELRIPASASVAVPCVDSGPHNDGRS